MSKYEQDWIREFKFSSFSEKFRKYVEDLKYRKLTCLNFTTSSWIFWNPRGEDLHHNIMSKLEGMPIMKTSLIQFWIATEVDDGRQLLLTTRDQPFVMTEPEDKGTFSKGLCEYRMSVSLSNYDINSSIKAEEKDVDVIGRVFKNRRIEFTPNVSYYSSKEYPHRDLALSCGIKSCVTFPYLESNGKFLGVIEMVSLSELDLQFWSHLQEIVSSNNLKKRGWTWMPLSKGLCGHYDEDDASIHNAMSEIHDVLKVVDTSHDLVLARTWTLCKSCNVFYLVGSIDRRLESFLKSSVNDQNNFVFAQRFCPLQKGEGVVGKTLLSHGIVYCENVSKMSISEYPLAHFARHDNLSTCFAVCLSSTLTESEVYVLEFFLHPNNFDDVKATIVSILESLTHNFQTFKLASGDEIGDNLSTQFKFETLEMRVDPINSGKFGISTTEKRDLAIVLLENQDIGMDENWDAELTLRTRLQRNFENQCINKDETLGDNRRGKLPIEGFGAELSLQPYSEGNLENQRINNDEILGDNRRGKSLIELIDAECSLHTISEENYADKQRRVTATTDECIISSAPIPLRKGGIPIRLEELEKVSGMKRKEAAANLGVSVSTLKRVCREFEISRWPPRKKIMNNQFDSKKSVENASLTLSGGVSTIIQEESRATVKSKNKSTSSNIQDERRVMIKAKYGDNFIKFQLSSSSCIDALHEQIFRRLKLEAGTYNVKYQDEDNDWILIACDDDLRGYISSSISVGNTTLILLLESIA